MVMDVIIGAAGGNLKATLTQETLVLAAQKMREATTESSHRFKGIKDQYGTIISNESGKSEGVDGDNKKNGGGRIDLAEWEKRGAIKRAEVNEKSISGYKEYEEGCVKFNLVDKNNNPMSIKQFIEDPANRDMISPLGGHQGWEGQTFGQGYEPGSLVGRLVESYSGSHDFLNSPWFYDRLGNNRDISGTIIGKLEPVINGGDVALATPFGLSVFLPPEVWNAVHVIIH
jgi:filamentous hemagglutinin